MIRDGSILSDDIYGNLDEDEYETLIKHEYAISRADKFTYKHVYMGYYKRICNETLGWQCRHHMSKLSCDNLLHILGNTIKFDEIKPSNSTTGNGPITPEIVLYSGLRFMGGYMSRSLADVFVMSVDSDNCSIDIFESC